MRFYGRHAVRELLAYLVKVPEGDLSGIALLLQ